MYTNIAEPIRCEELTSLLRLCGIASTEIEESASDYTYLQAICKAIPLLQGHLFESEFYRVLDRMQLRYTPNALDAEAIWKQSAEYLQRYGWNGENTTMPTSPIRDASFVWAKSASYPLIDADPWLITRATNWTDWEKELLTHWESAFGGVNTPYVKLSLTYSERVPSLYHVDRALCAQNNNAQVLSAQLLRFLCAQCNKDRKTLLIEIGAQQATQLLKQLHRLEQSIGLPALILSFQTTEDFNVLRAFAEQAKETELCLGVPDIGEMPPVPFSAIAAKYPIGRLFYYQVAPQTITVFNLYV